MGCGLDISRVGPPSSRWQWHRELGLDRRSRGGSIGKPAAWHNRYQGHHHGRWLQWEVVALRPAVGYDAAFGPPGLVLF